MSRLADAIRKEVYQLLLQHGLSDGDASDEARHLLDRIQRSFGGESHYVRAPDRRARRAAIRAEIEAGSDHKSVAAKYRVSQKTVSRALRRDEASGFGSLDWEL